MQADQSVYQQLDTSILYEDDAVLFLNKPAGWVVNRSHTYPGLTVQDWAEQRFGIAQMQLPEVSAEEDEEHPYGTPEEIFRSRGGIAHRLDKDTSGVLTLAKTPAALQAVLAAFKQRTVHKTYKALVHGKVVPMQGTIRLPLGRSRSEKLQFAIDPHGKMSETSYLVETYYPGLPRTISPKKGKSYQGFTLVTLEPHTGRTHQIRVHMAAIKHPLVGDEVYAGGKRIRVDRDWCPRQFLHAASLTLPHPSTGDALTIEAPLAPDLEAVLGLFQE